MQTYALEARKSARIELVDMAMVGKVIGQNGHLSAPDASTNIAHAVVVAYLFVMVVGAVFARLRGIEHGP